MIHQRPLQKRRGPGLTEPSILFPDGRKYPRFGFYSSLLTSWPTAIAKTYIHRTSQHHSRAFSGKLAPMKVLMSIEYIYFWFPYAQSTVKCPDYCRRLLRKVNITLMIAQQMRTTVKWFRIQPTWSHDKREAGTLFLSSHRGHGQLSPRIISS